MHRTTRASAGPSEAPANAAHLSQPTATPRLSPAAHRTERTASATADGAGPASATPPLVHCAGVSCTLDGHPVLADLDLDVAAGERIAVIGASGCGKSTLLRLLAGLLTPDSGTLAVAGRTAARDRTGACALTPQGDSLLPWLDLTDNVAVPLRNRGMRHRAARARVQALLADWGLAEAAGRRPAALSGGQRQRAALLRALVADKPVLLADEPLGALDAITRADAQDWLRRRLRETATAMVLVTHDVDEALVLADRVLLLAGRPAAVRLVESGWLADPRPRDELVGDPALAAARARLLVALRADRGADPTATGGVVTTGRECVA